MDKIILSVLAIVLSGAGLFVALTKFNVPELNMAFFGENPFAIKRDEIETVMTWPFALLAMLGLLLQAVVAMFDLQLQDRAHTTGF